MPVRRLVLPREVAGVNAVEVSGPLASAPTGPGDVVVLVVPSTARVVQAGWLQALGRRSWSRFADWLPGALEDPEGSWRWDRLAARWAGEVGADRVHVVAGDAPDAAAETLTVLAGEPVSVSGWARTLIGAEVAAVESLVAELEELGLDGRNAADLLDGAVAAMVRTPAVGGTAPAADAVPERERVAAEAGRMLSTLEASGVHVHGDRAALAMTAPAPGSADRVGLAAAVALSVGALERVTTWAHAGEDA